jgi:hypothetical protein
MASSYAISKLAKHALNITSQAESWLEKAMLKETNK